MKNCRADSALLLTMVRFWRGTLQQPFAVKLFKGIEAAHPQFTNRTVMVKNNDIDTAFIALNR